MNTINKLLSFALLSLLLFTACQKEEKLNDQEQTQQIIISTEDHTAAEDLYQNVEDQVDEAIETRGGGGDCPTVTATPDWQTYPRTVTIDFGDGCVGADGRTRKGQIKIEGSRNWTNQGYDANGNITLSRTVADGRITYPDGTSATWESNGYLTQTAGGQTPLNFFDNVFQITGSASGINREGVPFQVVIDDALVKDKICPWFVSGILTLTVDNVDVSVDYGSGNCDNRAVLTLPNGTKHDIIIR